MFEFSEGSSFLQVKCRSILFEFSEGSSFVQVKCRSILFEFSEGSSSSFNLVAGLVKLAVKRRSGFPDVC